MLTSLAQLPPKHSKTVKIQTINSVKTSFELSSKGKLANLEQNYMFEMFNKQTLTIFCSVRQP